MIPEKSQTPLETRDIFNGNLQIIAKKSSASAPHTHRIQISRLEAKGLRKARLFGKNALFPYIHIIELPSPFAVITVGGAQTKTTTPILSSLNVSWRENFELYVFS